MRDKQTAMLNLCKEEYFMEEKSQMHLDNTKDKPFCQWTQQDYIDLICTGCQFYEPQEEKLECAAFQILVKLLRSEEISVDQVERSQCKKRG